ncbi:MAG: elongation factor P [Calditrichaeota bacterium]|nr:elongation factor P [Calditrichota bacterium]
MATTADIKKGVVIDLEGGLWTIVDFQHVKPGKGGAFVRNTLKNIVTGKVIDRTLRSGEKIEIIKLDPRQMQFLYHDGDHFQFMDQETFEQVAVPEAVVGDAALFLKEGEIVKIAFNDETPLTIEIPFFIEYTIVQCEPGVKGDTVSNVTKPAKIETGATVQVPLFVESGERIRVDTRTGQYIERVR